NCGINHNSGKPIWSHDGHDPRHTGNINALETHIRTVNAGVEYWTYTFSSFNSDGSEITIDSKGNIYFLNQANQGKLYKFSPEGNVIWELDTISTYNYFGKIGRASCRERV